MAADVDICNLALSHLGQNANIATIDPPDASQWSQTMATFFPMARDTMLERAHWTFATKRASLSSLTLDVDGWSYKYALPSDFLRPISLLPDDSTDDDMGYQFTIENNALYANIENPTLRYTAKVTDMTKWTPLAKHALSWLLAAFSAGTIIRGQDPRTLAYLHDRANLALAEAMSQDAKKRRHLPRHVPAHLRARGGVADDESFPINRR